jgi:cytochrome c-type biogenesis protein CcmH/NrfG
LLEFTLTEVLTEQEYSTLLEQRRSEEPEKDVSMVSGRDLEGIRSILQTVACSAFPVVILVAVMLRARRKDVGSEPPRLAENDEVHDAQAIGIEGFKPSSPEEYYFLGKVLLDRGEFAQAIKAFTEAYRVAEDPILKNEALKQLEGLDAVKKL